ncbi:MAG: hypothetical protein ACLT1J_02810 [Mediterraneibacter gnavus]
MERSAQLRGPIGKRSPSQFPKKAGKSDLSPESGKMVRTVLV